MLYACLQGKYRRNDNNTMVKKPMPMPMLVTMSMPKTMLAMIDNGDDDIK
jgi:hypothetical protein